MNDTVATLTEDVVWPNARVKMFPTALTVGGRGTFQSWFMESSTVALGLTPDGRWLCAMHPVKKKQLKQTQGRLVWSLVYDNALEARRYRRSLSASVRSGLSAAVPSCFRIGFDRSWAFLFPY